MITFESDIPHCKAKFILVRNYPDEVWNFAVKDYKIYSNSASIGVWKIKQLKQ